MTRAQGNREAICLAEQPSHVRPARAAGAASASGSSAAHTASLEHTTVRDSRSWQCQRPSRPFQLEEDLLHLSSRWSGRYVRPNSPHPDARASLRHQKASCVQLHVRKRVSQLLESRANRVDLWIATTVPLEQAGHVLADDQLRAEAPRVLQNAMKGLTCLARLRTSPHPGRCFPRQ
jgi:hypothetical protein